jgi:hypothetical protein
MRNEQRAHKLTSDTGWGGHGKEMQKPVESKNKEGETEEQPGNNSSCFHGTVI